jgi:hypothetical protein
MIGHSGRQGAFGPDYGEVDPMLFCDLDHSLPV